MGASAATASGTCPTTADRCPATTAKGTPCRGVPPAGEQFCAPHLRRAGRKSKVDSAQAMLVVEGIRNALNFRQACAGAGISEPTAYSWRARGRRDLIEGVESPYSEFLKAYRQAWAECELMLMVNLRQAMPSKWWAAAAFLQHSDPESWNLGYIIRRLEANPPWKKEQARGSGFTLSMLPPPQRAQLRALLKEVREQTHVETLARCGAKTSQGAQCRKKVKRGAALCPVHLGHARRLSEQERRAMAIALPFIAYGASYISACLLAGIQKEKARLWKRLGRGSVEGRTGSPYERFGRQVIEAEGKATLHALHWLEKGGERDCRAIIWQLERVATVHWCTAYRERLTPEQNAWIDGPRI